MLFGIQNDDNIPQALFTGIAAAIECISLLPPRMDANDIFFLNRICDRLKMYKYKTRGPLPLFYKMQSYTTLLLQFYKRLPMHALVNAS